MIVMDWRGIFPSAGEGVDRNHIKGQFLLQFSVGKVIRLVGPSGWGSGRDEGEGRQKRR